MIISKIEIQEVTTPKKEKENSSMESRLAKRNLKTCCIFYIELTYTTHFKRFLNIFIGIISRKIKINHCFIVVYTTKIKTGNVTH